MRTQQLAIQFTTAKLVSLPDEFAERMQQKYLHPTARNPRQLGSVYAGV